MHTQSEDSPSKSISEDTCRASASVTSPQTSPISALTSSKLRLPVLLTSYLQNTRHTHVCFVTRTQHACRTDNLTKTPQHAHQADTLAVAHTPHHAHQAETRHSTHTPQKHVAWKLNALAFLAYTCSTQHQEHHSSQRACLAQTNPLVCLTHTRAHSSTAYNTLHSVSG